MSSSQILFSKVVTRRNIRASTFAIKFKKKGYDNVDQKFKEKKVKKMQKQISCTQKNMFDYIKSIN